MSAVTPETLEVTCSFLNEVHGTFFSTDEIAVELVPLPFYKGGVLVRGRAGDRVCLLILQLPWLIVPVQSMESIWQANEIIELAINDETITDYLRLICEAQTMLDQTGHFFHLYDGNVRIPGVRIEPRKPVLTGKDDLGQPLCDCLIIQPDGVYRIVVAIDPVAGKLTTISAEYMGGPGATLH